MKRTVLFAIIFCCSLILPGARAQEQEKQEPQPKEPQGSQQQAEPPDKDKPSWAKDLSLMTSFTYERGTWTFHFSVTNRHSSVAYRDLKYEIAWFGSETAEEKTVKDVIAPGKSIEFSESKPGPSPFGKVKSGAGSGMILVTKEKDMVVGIAVNEDQLDESIRTKVKIVGAEPKLDSPDSKSPEKNR